jgi:hypothetical protein
LDFGGGPSGKVAWKEGKMSLSGEGRDKKWRKERSWAGSQNYNPLIQTLNLGMTA